MAQVVERLVGHAAGEGAVADHGHHPAVAALELEGGGQAVGVAQDGRGVAVLHPVVLGLGAVRVARQAAGLAQLGEGLPPPGDELVDVGLVAGVPQQDVAGRVEHPVQGQGQLDHAQVGPQVAAGDGDRLDDELPDLGRKDVQLFGGERPEVGGTVDVFEDHGSVGTFCSGYQRTTGATSQTTLGRAFRSGPAPPVAALSGPGPGGRLVLASAARIRADWGSGRGAGHQPRRSHAGRCQGNHAPSVSR